MGLEPVTISESVKTYLLHLILFNDPLQIATQHTGKHHLLAYAEDANLLGENIDTAQKIKETLNDASKEVVLDASTEKTRYMLLPCH
jgi:hypothetical protein